MSAQGGPAKGPSKSQQRTARFARRESSSAEQSSSSIISEMLLRSASSEEILTEIIKNIGGGGNCSTGGVVAAITKGRRLTYLNALVKFITLTKGRDRSAWGYTPLEVLLSLRPSLVNEATVVRVAGLRALRYLIQTKEDLKDFQKAGISLLLTRALDVVLNNSAERVQAVRVCQRLLGIPDCSAEFPPSVTRALIAIGTDGKEEGDKLHKTALSLLCQLAVLSSQQFIECGGVRVLLLNILRSTSSPMVLEALLGSLLHLLNHPHTRDKAGLDLSALVAPFTDVHWRGAPNECGEVGVDEREAGRAAAKVAIATVLRSWSGLAHFSLPNSSGLQALVDALYMQQLEIRRSILDLLCEILGIVFPTWSDEVGVALSAVDPSAPRPEWRLGEGFVSSEAAAILPHLANTTPNLLGNHMALVILALVQRGLLEALVEVVVSGDGFISLRGTVLLGEVLHLLDAYIPTQVIHPTHALPSLILASGDATGIGQQQQRALEALSVLSSLQKLKSRPPTPASLFLSAQLDYAGYSTRGPSSNFTNKLGQVQVMRGLKRELDANPGGLIKETGVLTSKDYSVWGWEKILVLLRLAPGPLRRVQDASTLNFLKRLLDFFRPSANSFARLEMGKKGVGGVAAKAGLALVNFLANQVESFSGETLLQGLLADIANQLDEIVGQREGNPWACFLSPPKLETTVSGTYFLMLGTLADTPKGSVLLTQGQIFSRLTDIIMGVEEPCYVKLIVSSLSYKEEGARKVLGAALNAPFASSRLYATSFLRVLVRSRLTGFAQWGIDLLVKGLKDPDARVSRTALEILEEAVYDKMYLESLIALRPDLSTLGDRGVLLKVTWLSLPSGFRLLEDNWLKEEVVKWRAHFNKRYVELVEVLVRDVVSSLRRGEDGKYPRRAEGSKRGWGSTGWWGNAAPIFLPPHLYSQLSQTKEGLDIILDIGDVYGLMNVIKTGETSSAEGTRELKAAIWAVAHLGTAPEALPLLEDAGVLARFVELGSSCSVLSLRHTLFHALCLLATTVPGADALKKFGWHAMPRSHHEAFTIWSPPEAFLVDEGKRQLLRRLDLELPEGEDEDGDLLSPQGGDGEDGDLGDLLQKEGDSTGDILLLEEEDEVDQGTSTSYPGDGGDELKSCSLTTTSGGGGVAAGSPLLLKWSHAHHRSVSDSHALSSSSSSGRPSRLPQQKGPPSSIASSTRWRKDSVTESSTSGVSSGGESGLLLLGAAAPLSPIPSSASINTNNNNTVGSPPSRGSSRATLTEPLSLIQGSSTYYQGRYGSPLHHRSLRLRRPFNLRASLGTSSSLGEVVEGRRGSFGGGRGTVGALFSPGDLFRPTMASSLTSLSTPSFRLRPEWETKGRCYMGLCVPEDFSLIFFTEEPPQQDDNCVALLDESGSSSSTGGGDDSFEFHTEEGCLGCFGKTNKDPPPLEEEKIPEEAIVTLLEVQEDILLSTINRDAGTFMEKKGLERSKLAPLIRKETLRLVSNLISSIGAKANEQGLLRLKQSFPWAFADSSVCCLYTEVSLIMCRYNLRLPLRRFLQELFFDMPFSQFDDIVREILERHNGNGKCGIKEEEDDRKNVLKEEP